MQLFSLDNTTPFLLQAQMNPCETKRFHFKAEDVSSSGLSDPNLFST